MWVSTGDVVNPAGESKHQQNADPQYVVSSRLVSTPLPRRCASSMRGGKQLLQEAVSHWSCLSSNEIL
jgi:hypothetical protein